MSNDSHQDNSIHATIATINPPLSIANFSGNTITLATPIGPAIPAGTPLAITVTIDDKPATRIVYAAREVIPGAVVIEYVRHGRTQHNATHETTGGESVA